MEKNKTSIENWNLLKTLNPFIQDIWAKSGFTFPTEIQKLAMPLIMDGKDVIAESPTGTGKTVAYLIPLLERIDPSQSQTQAVILAPSHELVMQIYQEVQKWTKGSEITSAALIGGANIKKQVENLKKHPQVVVGTTGRVLELIKIKKLKMHGVKVLVVDEFDMQVAQEHIENMNSIIKSTLRERQLLFFSATLPANAEKIAREISNEPEVVKVMKENSLSEKVTHLYFEAEQRDKIDVLRSILNAITEKVIVFVNDIGKLSEIESKLKFKGIKLEVLEGASNKKNRKNAIQSFRDGKINVLLATDIAARGLDIEDLTYVIHFDLPRDSKQYLHRSGRTGRMGKAGIVITLITNKDINPYKKITRDLQIVPVEKVLFKGEITDKRAKRKPNRK